MYYDETQKMSLKGARKEYVASSINKKNKTKKKKTRNLKNQNNKKTNKTSNTH